MFKQMRKKERELNNQDIEEILISGEYGVLSTTSNNGYPYAVPLSYVYYNNSIYIHCAEEGHKLENIIKYNKVCFCVVTDTEVLPNKFSTKYKSVIAFGTAAKVDEEKKEDVLLMLLKKYSPDYLKEGQTYIDKAKFKTTLIKISIQHKTGKARV